MAKNYSDDRYTISSKHDNIVSLEYKNTTMSLLTFKELRQKYPEYDFWDEAQLDFLYQEKLLDGEPKSTNQELKILEESFIKLVHFREGIAKSNEESIKDI